MGAALGLAIDGWMLLRISAHSLEVCLMVSSSFVLILGVRVPVQMATKAS
jgi:hypothetical protein